MRKITHIIIHCTATRADRSFSVQALEASHKARGIPADTRTDAQKRSMAALLRSLRLDYPDACIIGHRDLPGVKKACPCFDVKAWLQSIGLHR